ncbi:hypothetical protein EXD82_04150 [Peptacetobacter hominis]|uniref:Arylsulfotransferase N-terminal domain-containing protein n=1 Tax=Peptacetobacter hominis TaxID=2743610 RepID=A0A544QVW7_9FIRM|nr:aryl-sulfate sulfotransferase [Peptacetobacter hominis]TQQ84824.1 hypothetical protein EXD82_04150 [Peptacetobacter hominis]
MKKIFIAIAAVVLTAVIVVFAVGNINKDDGRNFNIEFNGKSISMNSNNGEKGYNVSEMRTGAVNNIKIKDISEVEQIKINDIEYPVKSELKYSISSIDDENKIKLSVKFSDDNGTYDYYINTMSTDFPGYSVKAESPYDGDYYMTTHNEEHNYVFVLNEDGSMKYYKETESNPFNFQKVTTEDGDIRYLYMDTLKDKSYRISSIGYSPTQLVVLDENYNEINNIMMSEYDTIEEGDPLENHDYIYIDDNHYILSSYQQVTATNIPDSVSGGKTPEVVEEVIQEVKDGKVVWQWRSSQYPELYAQSKEGNTYSEENDSALDYLHFNSMTIDESDGNLVCSFRNLDEVVKINRKTGEIMWTLGGDGDDFSMTEEQKFSRQHHVTFTDDGYITVYDNGDKNESTRIVKLKLDEKNMKVTEYASYDIGDFYKYMGSVSEVDKDNQVFMIGTGGKTSEQDTVAFEKNFSTGEVYFEFGFDSGESMYRCHKIK